MQRQHTDFGTDFWSPCCTFGMSLKWATKGWLGFLTTLVKTSQPVCTWQGLSLAGLDMIKARTGGNSSASLGIAFSTEVCTEPSAALNSKGQINVEAAPSSETSKKNFPQSQLKLCKSRSHRTYPIRPGSSAAGHRTRATRTLDTSVHDLIGWQKMQNSSKGAPNPSGDSGHIMPRSCLQDCTLRWGQLRERDSSLKKCYIKTTNKYSTQENGAAQKYTYLDLLMPRL